MEGTQTLTLTVVQGKNGRNYIVLNDGEFMADEETSQVFHWVDTDCQNPLGLHDGSGTFTAQPDTPVAAMAGMSLGGKDDAEEVRKEREAKYWEQHKEPEEESSSEMSFEEEAEAGYGEAAQAVEAQGAAGFGEESGAAGPSKTQQRARASQLKAEKGAVGDDRR